MFKLDLSPTYTLPVTVQVRDAAGASQPETFHAEFLRMGPDEFQAYRATIEAQQLSNIDIARKVLVGWSEMADAAGAPVPYSDAARDALLGQVTGAAEAVLRTWYESVMEDVRKNLLPSAATGPEAAMTATA